MYLYHATAPGSRLSTPAGSGPSGGYQPGACNIGPEEIARRRRTGYAGAAATVAVAGTVLVADASPAWMTAAFPLAAAAFSGFLQARWRFCANFGWRGRYNFGRLGGGQRVAAEDTRHIDRRRALQIAAYSITAGLATAIGLYVLAAALS